MSDVLFTGERYRVSGELSDPLRVYWVGVPVLSAS